MKYRLGRYIVALVVASLVCIAYVWPQAGTGELTGLVTDPAGGVIVGAAIELTNNATGAVRTTVTSDAGIYRFVSLPVIGKYTLTLKQPGFNAAKMENIEITVGTTLTADLWLEIGAPSEMIAVIGGADLVQTTESAVSTLIDNNIWKNMPLEVRSQNAFIELVAGAVPNDMAGNTRGAAVNGARGGAGNYMVEGVDNNEQGQSGRGQLGGDPGGASTSISPDMIAEYRVITNNFTAEYGRSGGFVTDTVLKSGTNKFHGSAFEYNRVQALAANDFFSNKAGIQDSLVRNQFGFSAGGPIRKDKAFFFYSTEWHRMRRGSTLSGTGITRQFIDWVNAGNLQKWAESDPDGVCMQYLGTACPGGFANSGKIGPIFDKLYKAGPFPLATEGFSNEGAGYYTGGLMYPVPVYGDIYVQDPYHLNEYRISAKGDYSLNAANQVSFIYLNQTASSGNLYGGGVNVLGPASLRDGRGQNAALTWTSSIGPTTANSFKVSFLRRRSDSPAPEGTQGIPHIVTWYDPLTIGFGLYSGLPQYFTDNQFQYQDHISFIRGKHSFKAGAEYRRTRNGSSFFNDTFGTFYPYGIEDLITDLAFTDEADLAIEESFVNGSVYYASAAVNPATKTLPEVYRGFRANEVAAYFQDEWRVTPRLTLTMGLRYEYFGPPHNFRKDIDSNFYFGTPVTPVVTTSNNPYFPKNNGFYAGVATAAFQVRNNEIWNKDTNNFAPRLGFALDVLGNHKLVLRAGAGVMYDRIYNNVFENIRFNPPFFADNQIGTSMNGVPVGQLSTPGLYEVPFDNNPVFAGGYSAKPNPRHMDQNMVSPYYGQFHVGLEWEVAKSYALTGEYISTIGRKLIGYYDINTFNGRTVSKYNSTRINTIIAADNYRNNNFRSSYHAMQLGIRRNFAAGLGLNANYTWSRALDDSSDMFYARGPADGPTDTMNPMADWGPADFHMAHRFVTSFSYRLPFMKKNRYLGGWQLNSIVTLQSGVPFSPYSANIDLNKDGRASDRIVYLGSGSPMNSLLDGSAADGYFGKAQWGRYTCPATVNNGDWCNSPQGRGTITGPGYQNVDFSIQKKFAIYEDVQFTLMGNFFNFFNHTNFDLPGFNQNSSTFGRSTSAYSPRITQIALRVDF